MMNRHVCVSFCSPISLIYYEGEKYRDMLTYVYDISSYSWCEGFDDWFSPSYVATDDNSRGHSMIRFDGQSVNHFNATKPV
jgi:hypothetical protein